MMIRQPGPFRERSVSGREGLEFEKSLWIMSDNYFRLVTRSDLDGLVCAALLKEQDMIDDIKFVRPKDMQDSTILISDG